MLLYLVQHAELEVLRFFGAQQIKAIAVNRPHVHLREADDLAEDSLEELKARRAEAQSGSIDVDETELAESLELPGADLSNLSGEELTVRVLPKQDDEFTCSVCFLVHHRSRLARERNGQYICRDCA